MRFPQIARKFGVEGTEGARGRAGEGGDEGAEVSDVLPDQTCFFTFMETLLKKHPIPLSVVAKTRVNEEVNIRSGFVPDQVFVYRFSANKFDKMSLALLRGFEGDLFWAENAAICDFSKNSPHDDSDK